jgi:hypothetical protein
VPALEILGGNMEKRPLSLTIIGWWMVIGAVFNAVGLLTIQWNTGLLSAIENLGMPLLVYQIMTGINVIVALVSAYGVFKGLPWSRVLYVTWMLISEVISLYTTPMRSAVILGLLSLGIIVFFLFRPAADRWFRARGLQLQRGEM